jgi:hypothetical protein
MKQKLRNDVMLVVETFLKFKESDMPSVNEMLFAYEQLRVNPGQKYLEEIIAENANLSCNYAINIKSPFPAGEIAISDSSHYSYVYAERVLRGRFELGEKAISQICDLSYKYAFSVIKQRFVEGETAIARDPHNSFYYAFNVLHGRFVEGEQAISRHYFWYCQYNHNFLARS